MDFANPNALITRCICTATVTRERIMLSLNLILKGGLWLIRLLLQLLLLRFEIICGKIRPFFFRERDQLWRERPQFGRSLDETKGPKKKGLMDGFGKD